MNIFLDVETIRSMRPDVGAWLAAKHYDPADLEGSARKAADALTATSLNPRLGELVCVGIATDGDSPPHVVVRDMTDPEGERRLLVEVAQQVRDMIDDMGGRRNLDRIVAHNAAFDRHFLAQRAMVWRTSMPPDLHALGLKPWDTHWFCTMDALRMDTRDRVSLDEACLAFGVPLKHATGAIDGSQVTDAVLAGRIDEVAAYCADDVRRVRAVYYAIQSVRVSA